MAKRKKNGAVLTPEKVLAMEFNEFSNGLNAFTERQLIKVLELELKTKARSSYVERIRQRHASRREEREKRELEKRLGAA